VRKLLAPVAAAGLLLVMVTTVFAWQATLTSDCAPDANSFAWKINLQTEPNYNIEFSWHSDFTAPWTVDFVTDGDHSFTTARGGETLYFRWVSDHSSKGQADANGDLCAPPPAPDIQIVKSNDAADTVEPGTEVTYTYEVTNTGNVPLTDVAVNDQIMGSENAACEPVAYDSSDGNDDDILDPGETWTFTCTTTLESTTSNEACVSANVVDEVDEDLVKVDQQSEPVEDCDDNTVEVSHSPAQSVAEQTVEAGTGTPAGSIPNTSLDGSGPNPLPTILFSLVLLGSLGTLAYTNVKVVARRKR
jgi:uncharacterized repeat protein (TIGR01451 family)